MTTLYYRFPEQGGSSMSGAQTIGTLDSQAAVPNGAVISGTVLYMQSATASDAGLVNILTQTMAGAKTFSTSVASPILQSSTANVASAGAVRLANADKIEFRNSTNNGNHIFGIGSNDNFAMDASLSVGGNALQASTFSLFGQSSGTLTITSPSAITDYTLTVPSVQGAAKSVIQNSGAGILSWVTLGADVTSSVSTLTNFPAATGTWGNFTSVSLPAGKYIVSGTLDTTANGATVSAAAGSIYMAISINSGVTTTDQVIGLNQITMLAPSAASDRGGSLANYVLTVGSTTTVYFKGIATYSVAIPQYVCTLSAVRIA